MSVKTETSVTTFGKHLKERLTGRVYEKTFASACHGMLTLDTRETRWLHVWFLLEQL